MIYICYDFGVCFEFNMQISCLNYANCLAILGSSRAAEKDSAWYEMAGRVEANFV